MTIDSHVHLWDLRLGLHEPKVPSLQRSFSPSDLHAAVDNLNIDGVVLVEAAASLDETVAMLRAARHHELIRGVVGWVPLTSADSTKAALHRFESEDAFCGVRLRTAPGAGPDSLLAPEVVACLDVLAGFDLAFDVQTVTRQHLEQLATLAETLPGLRIVLNHLGGSVVHDSGFSVWAELLTDIAEHPNVVAKLSSLAPHVEPCRWSAADLMPYIEHAIATFGPERLMFGSNWPVSLRSGDYRKNLGELERCLADLTPSQRERIMAGTAREVYRIDP